MYNFKSKTLGNIPGYKLTCFRPIAPYICIGKSCKYRFFEHFGAKSSVKRCFIPFYWMFQSSKAFANILTKFQKFRLPIGVSRGSHWEVILSKIVTKRHFRDFIDI